LCNKLLKKNNKKLKYKILKQRKVYYKNREKEPATLYFFKQNKSLKDYSLILRQTTENKSEKK